MAVSVHKLIQRGEARHSLRDRIALEDALHTTLPDDGRLVLVRRLQVRGRLADPARRQDAVRSGWVEAVAGAVHGVSGAANIANCVWFASSEEAEALLLLKLLAGEPVIGWFWPLAVPGWRQLPLSDWLPRVVASCLEAKDAARLARIVETFVQAGEIARIVEVFERAFPASRGPPGTIDQLLAQAASSEAALPSPIEDEAVATRIAVQLAPRILSLAWREMFASLDSSTLPSATKDRVIAAILEERIRCASPALSLRPRILKRVAKAMREIRIERSFAPESQPLPSDSGTLAKDRRRTDESAPQIERGLATQPLEEHSDGPPAERVVQMSDHRPPEQLADAEPAERLSLRTSRHAGLWLIVPSLIHLGFGEWLADRAELLGDDPGRSLILAVARHHRVALDDPALAPLEPFAAGEALPEWTEMWRFGLDRWLRRTARRRTHDLVGRAGKLALGEDRAVIHFPLNAADLRLRRVALDVDPGWVVWLGLSIRYRFDRGCAQ